MEDEIKTAVADIQEQSVAPVTPTEQVAPPTTEVAATSQESKETTGKEVSNGVQKRIDQVTSKYYAALDREKQLAAKVKELEGVTAPKVPAKEVSMFEEEEPEDGGKAEVARLKKTVDAMEEQRISEKRIADFTELFGELREKYSNITFEDSMRIVEELNKDDVPPQARGVVEKYFAAHEAETLRTKLQEKETKQERKAAVTETTSITADDHFPDDPMEALELLKSDPAKYEALAKKTGRRG